MAEDTEFFDNYIEKEKITQEDLEQLLITMEEEMIKAAEALEFERAANLRDEIRKLKNGKM